MTGLAVGLRVGLPATAHWVAKSLNLWSVAIGGRRRERIIRKELGLLAGERK